MKAKIFDLPVTSLFEFLNKQHQEKLTLDLALKNNYFVIYFQLYFCNNSKADNSNVSEKKRS